MIVENDFLTPEWPEPLQDVDVVKVRFVLVFTTSCSLQPADFLGMGRVLRMAGKQGLDPHNDLSRRQWAALFQPALSDDPVARRKYQKPAPAFVLTMPIMQRESYDVDDQLELEVLFIGTGIPLIHEFLRSLIHLGSLGLISGEGRFTVSKLYSQESDCSERLVWAHNAPIDGLACSVLPLPWFLPQERIHQHLTVKYVTPARLIVDGKPLRKPNLEQMFPFMLRRVTSFLYAHCEQEVLDDPAYLLSQLALLNVTGEQFRWYDWRPVKGRQEMAVGGFMGQLTIHGHALEKVYWVFAIASMLGIGKGATYGSGRFELNL